MNYMNLQNEIWYAALDQLIGTELNRDMNSKLGKGNKLLTLNHFWCF